MADAISFNIHNVILDSSFIVLDTVNLAEREWAAAMSQNMLEGSHSCWWLGEIETSLAHHT